MTKSSSTAEQGTLKSLRRSDAVQEWLRALKDYKNGQIEQTRSLEKLLYLLGSETGSFDGAHGASTETSASREVVKHETSKDTLRFKILRIPSCF